MANTLKWPALKYQGPQLDPKTVQARTDKALRLAAGQHSTTAPLGQLPYTPQFGMPPMGSAMPYMGAPTALQPPQQGLQPQQGIQPGMVPMPGFSDGGSVSTSGYSGPDVGPYGQDPEQTDEERLRGQVGDAFYDLKSPPGSLYGGAPWPAPAVDPKAQALAAFGQMTFANQPQMAQAIADSRPRAMTPEEASQAGGYAYIQRPPSDPQYQAMALPQHTQVFGNGLTPVTAEHEGLHFWFAGLSPEDKQGVLDRAASLLPPEGRRAAQERAGDPLYYDEHRVINYLTAADKESGRDKGALRNLPPDFADYLRSLQYKGPGFAEGGDVEIDPDEEQRQRDAERMANPQAFAGTSTAPGPPAPVAGPPVPSYADNVQAMASQLTPQQINDAAKEAMAAGVYDQTLPVLRDLQAGVMTQGEKGLINPTVPVVGAARVTNAAEGMAGGASGAIRDFAQNTIMPSLQHTIIGGGPAGGQMAGIPSSTNYGQGQKAEIPYAKQAQDFAGNLGALGGGVTNAALGGAPNALLNKFGGPSLQDAGRVFAAQNIPTNVGDAALQIPLQVAGSSGPLEAFTNLPGLDSAVKNARAGLEANAVKGLEFRPQAPAIQEGSTAAQNILRANRAEAGIAGGAPKPMSPEDAVSFFRSQGMSDADIAAFARNNAPRGAGPDFTANLNAESDAARNAARNSYGTALERTGDPGTAVADARRAAALEGQMQRDIQTGKQTGIEDVRGPAAPADESRGGLGQTHFTSYEDARAAAQARADSTGLDVAVRKGSQYDPGFNVSYAAQNDSDYARAEIVRPREGPVGGGQANGPIAASPPPASLPAQAERVISPPLPGPNPFEAPPRPMPASAIGETAGVPSPRPPTNLPNADRSISPPLAGANPFEAPPRPLSPETGTGVPGGRIDELMQKAPGVQFADTAGMSNQELIAEAKRLGVPVDEGLITRGLPEGRNQELAKIQTALDAETEAKFGNMNRAERDYFEQLRAERGAGSTPASDFMNSQNGINSQAERVRGGIVPPDQMPPGATTAGNAIPPRPPSMAANAWREAVAVVREPVRVMLAGAHIARVGVGAAVTHPTDAYTALRAYGRALVDPEGAQALKAEVRNLPFVSGNGPEGLRAADFAAQRTGGYVSKAFADKMIDGIPGLGTIINRLGDAGSTYLSVLRDSIYNTAAQNIARDIPNASPDFYKDTYLAISHATGHSTGLGGNPVMGAAQGVGIGPNALVSRFQNMTDVLTKSGSVLPWDSGGRAEAVRSLLGIAGVIATTDLVGNLLGAKVNLPFGANATDITNPYGISSKLFKAETVSPNGAFKTVYGGGSGYDTLLRLFGNAYFDIQNHDTKALETHLASWGRGNVGPTGSVLIDLLTGSDWKGAPYDMNTLKGEARTAFIDRWAPIAAKSMYDAYNAWGPEGLVRAAPSLGAYEVQTAPRSLGELRQSALPEGTSYGDLFPHERQALNTALEAKYPDAFATAQENKDPAIRAYQEATQQARAAQNAEVDRIFKGVQSGTYDPIAARQAISAIKEQTAQQNAELSKNPDYQKAIGSIPSQDSTAQRVLDTYYAIPGAAKGPDGKVDWPTVDKMRQELFASLDNAGQKALSERLQHEVTASNPDDHPYLRLQKEEQPMISRYMSQPPVERNIARQANPMDDAMLAFLGYEPYVLTPEAARILQGLAPGQPAHVGHR